MAFIHTVAISYAGIDAIVTAVAIIFVALGIAFWRARVRRHKLPPNQRQQ